MIDDPTASASQQCPDVVDCCNRTAADAPEDGPSSPITAGPDMPASGDDGPQRSGPSNKPTPSAPALSVSTDTTSTTTTTTGMDVVDCCNQTAADAPEGPSSPITAGPDMPASGDDGQQHSGPSSESTPSAPALPVITDITTTTATTTATATTTNGTPRYAATRHQRNKSTSSAVFSHLVKQLGDPNGESTKQNRSMLASVLIIGALLLLFFVGMIGFMIVAFTNTYNNSIINHLALAQGSQAAKWWEHPPVSPLMSVHIFNYTNVERWKQGLDEKLHVADIGPYVYRETVNKVNVVFNANHTISYRESRSYEFLPELSTGMQYDTVVVPNVLLMSAHMRLQSLNPFIRFTLEATLSQYSVFKTVTAHSLIWGYDDRLYDTVKPFMTNAPERFGMLVSRNGISTETITIHTGVDDIEKLSVIDMFDGRRSLNMWATDECNRVDGSDGSQFPPHHMDKKHTLHVFAKAFCRRFPLHFAEEVNIMDGIPAWRYKAPLDVFAHPDQKAQNQCFCDQSGKCPPSGVFDVSKCFEAPILLSYPHFFTGNASLFANLDGLNPSEELHRTYADIHPRMAFPIGGASRIQINVQVAPSLLMVRKFEKGQILPVIWMEVSSGEISEELRATIYHSTFSMNAIELSLCYGTLLCCVVSVTLFGLFMSRRRRSQAEALAAKSTVKTSVTSASSAPSAPSTPSAPMLDASKAAAAALNSPV